MTSDQIKNVIGEVEAACENGKNITPYDFPLWEIAYQLALSNEISKKLDEAILADPPKMPKPLAERFEAESDDVGGRSEILQISGPTDDQDRAVFIHFKLTNGGRVHIPVDQIQRMWNAEQAAKKQPAWAKGGPIDP